MRDKQASSSLLICFSPWRLAVAGVVSFVVALSVSACEPGGTKGGAVVDGYGRSLRARCAPASAGATSCSGFEIGPAPTGGYVPGDIIDGQTGWGADDLEAAYNVPVYLPATEKLALLIGGNNPALESDLQVYRAQYALPECTTANGCLQIVNATGGTTFSSPRYEDIEESSMQLQVASAGCPNCQLLVVVATDEPTRTPTLPELAAAADEAVKLGATATVTSYGASELDENGQSWAAQYEKLFSTSQQFPLFAAAGDGGYLDGSSPDKGVRVPAGYPEVVAVGGTALAQVSADVSLRRWSETPLPTASSSCSTFTKPTFQKDTGCPTRTVNDLAASADGALVYFTTVDPASDDQPGWHTEGGTGESAALAASIFATSGQAYNAGPAFSYSNPFYFNDLTGGSNGTCGNNPYLCSGQIGYDGPSGNGSPNGTVFQGTFLGVATTSLSTTQNAGAGGELQTVGGWALSCPSLTFYAVGLPPGVSALFGGEEINGGTPFVQYSLFADLTAPLVQGARVTLVADCSGTLHTLAVFLDVTPCKAATTCLATDGVARLCGQYAPDGCGGTIACGGCDSYYICTNGSCTSQTIR